MDEARNNKGLPFNEFREAIDLVSKSHYFRGDCLACPKGERDIIEGLSFCKYHVIEILHGR